MKDDEIEKFAVETGAMLYAIHKHQDAINIEAGVNTSVNLIAMCAPKGGSFKYIRPDTGEEVIVEPGQTMYSTASMLATHYYNGKEWKEMLT